MKAFLASILGTCLLVMANSAISAAEDEPAALKPVNLDKVNSKGDEVDPYLAPGSYNLYYASNRSGRYKILVSHRTSVSQTWPVGKSVKEVNNVDAEADYRSPFLSRDGRFYYASNTVPRDPDRKFDKNFDLYFSRKYSARGFTMGTPVIAVCTADDELSPWVTAAGKEFYFSRKTKEGWKIYVAKGPALGAITAPKALDFPADFHHPTLSPNGLTMYLQGPVGKGRWGLFRSTRPRVGAPWEKPVELKALNSPEAPRGDMCPSLSPDGAKLYFASDRPGGKGGLDLWMIPVAKLHHK